MGEERMKEIISELVGELAEAADEEYFNETVNEIFTPEEMEYLGIEL